MTIEQEQKRREPGDIGRLVRGLDRIHASGANLREALDLIVQEAYAAVACDHLFLSRYEAASQQYRAIAWCSRGGVNPGDVSLDHKFMGSSYLTGQPVIIHDLANYNYRLRPGVARLGFLSMVGVPIVTRRGVVGVLEAFADDADHFSDLDADLLALFAKEAATVFERAELEMEGAYRIAENDFLLEALKLEQASIGSLFYRVGETFASVLRVDGIAIFGVEPTLVDNPLQEVMAKGFSMADIGRLKTLYNKEYLQNLVAKPDGLIKQSFRHGGAAKLLYTVPVLYKRALHGLIVFYWRQVDKATDMSSLECFIERLVGHITMVLGRKDIYANIQRISFFDLLTGLANRRLFDYVLDREFKKVRRSDKPLSLLMIDVDYFKTINDVYGHQVGDGVLEQIGAIMKENFRTIDLPARYGGEEFAVILPETGREQAVAIAERLRVGIAEHNFAAASGCVNTTVSIGGATYGGPGAGDASAERLILAADQALYRAKQLGRNITVFPDSH